MMYYPRAEHNMITHLFWLDLSCSEIFHTIHEAVFCQFIVGSQKFFELQNTKMDS